MITFTKKELNIIEGYLKASYVNLLKQTLEQLKKDPFEAERKAIDSTGLNCAQIIDLLNNFNLSLSEKYGFDFPKVPSFKEFRESKHKESNLKSPYF